MNDCDALRTAMGQDLPYESSCCSSCHDDDEGDYDELGHEEYEGKTYAVCCRVSNDFDEWKKKQTEHLSINQRRSMETVDFYPKTFNQIPDQDNPALDGGASKDCLMIVGAGVPADKDHAIVLRIEHKGHDSVTSVAKFWRHDLAVQYCDLIGSPIHV